MKGCWYFIIALSLLVFGCGEADRPAPAKQESRSGGPNIILIFLDALRADHLGCYGYDRPTSPAIDGLARGGVLARNVIPQSPGTFPSVHSILTSKYASRFFLNPRLSLPEEELTLAEILKENGYRTAAFSSQPLIVSRTEEGICGGGFEQGFDLFDETGPDGKRWKWEWKTPEGIIKKAVRWLDENYRSKFFLFLYIMDPHDKYRSPEPFNTLFDPDYRGRKMVKKGHASHYEQKILAGKESKLTGRDVEHLAALYDGEIRYADSEIAKLLKRLEELGISRDTLVIITSDHGEEFFEHRGLKHCYTLYNELLNVPLILSWPAKLPRGEVLDGYLIQSIDILPTILGLVGIEEPSGLEGESLLPLINKEETDWRESALSEAPFIDGKALITKKWKYIHRFGTDLLHGHLCPRYKFGCELYDLESDPGEKNNLYEREPERAARMLADLLDKIPPAEKERLESKLGLKLEQAAREKLESLGYLQ